jgi:hypothetical protein
LNSLSLVNVLFPWTFTALIEFVGFSRILKDCKAFPFNLLTSPHR